MKSVAMALLAAAAAFGAVDGTVLNGTSGKPEAGVQVMLLKLGQKGPELLASTRAGADGAFHFNQQLEPGPHLVEVAFDGVTYNTMLPPGVPASGVQVNVFSSTRKPDEAKVAQHMVLFEPSGDQLAVTDTYIFANAGKLTFNDAEAGTLRYFVPEAGKSSVRVMATAPQGMPVQRPAYETGKPGVFKLNFPIKPGETRIDVTYTMPGTAYEGRTLYQGGPTRLVAPAGVTIQGEGLSQVGQEPNSQAVIYEVKTAAYKVNIQGSGSMRAAAADDSGDDNGPQIQQILPPAFEEHRFLIMGVALVALALGFVLLYRKGSAAKA
jgi:hypothetical protein